MADVAVDIYLNIPESRVPFHFLSIPHSDIQRLSVRPFKWLQYIMFSICGARGDISEIPGGPPVDYDISLLAEVPYYYNLSEQCIFVDYDGSDGQVTITSTRHTACSRHFRDGVIQRDGCCLITGEYAEDCDAAHLIPRSKGDEYIMKVVQERSCLYGPTPPEISGIDDAQNGVLLSKDLHNKLGKGAVAFLKTPNYELQPIDIPVYPGHVGIGPYITLQHLKKSQNHNPNLLEQFAANPVPPFVAFMVGANADAQFQGTGALLPPNIILDFVYGIAAYRCWRSTKEESQDLMRKYHQEHYANLSLSSPSGENNGDDPSSEGSDDLNDSDYVHTPSRGTSTVSGDEMAKAMDELSAVLMWAHGITPQEAAKKRQKKLEEQEAKAQEVSQRKVAEWHSGVL